MGIAVFLLLLFVGWTIVLPIWSLVARSRARARADEAERLLAERGRSSKAFARSALAMEWTGKWRDEVPPPSPGPRIVVEPATIELRRGEAIAPLRIELPPDDLFTPAEIPPAVRVVEALPAPELPRPPPAKPRPPVPPPVRKIPIPPPAPSPAARGSEEEVREAVARYSAWREHVRPFLIANIGWFISGFLIVSGSLYFLREAWGSFAELGRHLLVVTTALAYAGGFVGIALWLKRKHGLETASRAMAYIGMALLPVAALVASRTFELRPLAWALVAPVVLGAAYPLLYLAAGLLDRPLAAPLARGLVVLLALVAVEPAIASLSPQAALAVPYLGWAVLHASSAAPLRGKQAPDAAVLAFHLSALAYTLLFVLGRAHALGGAALPFPAFYGPLAVLASFTALRVDVELRARWGGQPAIDAAVIASFAAALAGVALAMREPSLLALSGALAAAHFAVGLAWYRRPLLLYFSFASASIAVLALLSVLRIPDDVPAGELAVLALAVGAGWLGERFAARGEPRFERAARRFGWILFWLSVASAAAQAWQGRRLQPAAILAGAAAVAALWHWRRARASTAWAGAIATSAGAALFAWHALGLAGLHWAAAGVAALAAPFFLRQGERNGTSALTHCAVALGLIALAVNGLRVEELVFCASLLAICALALGNALVGLAASLSAVSIGALLIGGPAALGTLPDPLLQWAILPAAVLAATFALRAADRFEVRALPSFLPFSAQGLRALADPLLICASIVTLALAARGVFTIQMVGARLLVASSLCSLALAALWASPGWSAAAAGFFVVAGAWSAASSNGVAMPAFAVGAANGALLALIVARLARSRAGAHAESAIDIGVLALGGSTALALGSIFAGFDPKLAFAALAVSSLALIALAAPVRAPACWFGLVALCGTAGALPLVLGRPQTLAGPALASLALVLVWLRFAVRGAPPWTHPLLRTGPHAAALAALALNFAVPGAFLDWNRAICDGLLTAYLASALFVEGGVIFLHLLLAMTGLGVVRARTLLGIVPSGWGTVVAAAALLGLAAMLRKREKYANALLIWCALSIGYTVEWSLGAPRIRWGRMAGAALVAIPLAPQFFPLISSAAGIAALGFALLAALPPAMLLPATWPLGPAALALAFALAAEPIDRISSRRFCAPGELSKSLRAAAVLLSLAAAGMTSYAVLAAALRLPMVDSAGPGPMAAIPLVLGGAALALVFRKLDRAPPATWPLAAGIALAALAAALPTAVSWTPAGGALLLLVEAVIAAALVRWDTDFARVAPALWALSLAATHFAPWEWTTALALLGSVWFLREIELPGQLSLPTFGALAAAGFALAWAATRIAFLAPAGVAAPLGLLAAIAMLWHERRESAANATVLLVLSAAALSLGASSGAANARAAYVFPGGAMLLLLCAARARHDARWIYLAALPAVAAWWWSRTALGALSGVDGADAIACLATGFLLAFLQAALRDSPISGPLAHLAGILPIALFFVIPAGAISLYAGAAAALYGVLAWLRQSRIAAYVAVTLVNLALFSTWRARGLDDAQLYSVPLGLSLLAAAQISHGDLSRPQLSWLRGLGCLVLYAGTAMQMMRFDGPLYPVILMVLAIATVIAGIMLQIRSFAFLGAATVVADILANLIRASARSSRVMAVSATLTGFAILGAMIWLSVKREETLAAYRRLVRAMDDWE